MNLKRLIFFLFILVLIPEDTYAQNPEKDNIEFRSFDQEQIDHYKNSCNYYRLRTPPKGAWERFKEWIGEMLKKLLKNVPEQAVSGFIEVAIKVLLWVLGIFAITMIFITLFKRGVYSFMQKADKQIDINYEDLEARVPETNWQDLVDKEIEAKRYNLALRLLFLQSIQLLNEKQLIKWAKNKTNYDYSRELRQHQVDLSFSNLVQYYNYGWFGEFKLQEAEFNSIHTEFKTFNKSIG